VVVESQRFFVLNLEKAAMSHGPYNHRERDPDFLPAISIAMGSDNTIKGLTSTAVKYDGSPLRIAIVHARWNSIVIDALVEGTLKKLKEFGVQDSNIVIQSVPGSYELPLACSRFVVHS
jgi:ribosomal protein L27